LEAAVRELRAAGHQVLLMQPIPKPWKIHNGEISPTFDPERCTTLGVLRGRCPRAVVTTLDDQNGLQAAARWSISTAATRAGAGVLDLRPFLCGGATCSTMRDGRLVYRDAGHLTARESRALAPAFVSALRATRRARISKHG
jgi:hypothetical protein